MVYPNKMISFEEFVSKKSNFSPNDIDTWFKNLNENFYFKLQTCNIRSVFYAFKKLGIEPKICIANSNEIKILIN